MGTLIIKSSVYFSSLLVFVLFIICQVILAAADDEQIGSRTSNVHQFIYDGHPAAGPASSSPDWTGDSNPYSRNNKYLNNNDYYDSYPTAAQDKDYGYPAVKKPSKGKDSLWDFVENLFDKKNQWEEEIWDLIFHHKEEEKGHDYSAAAGYHGDHHKKPLSKEKVFEKIKFLAIAATVLLIVLGGGILLAPLAIGKGRRSLSEFLPQNVDSSTDIARLASNVLQAIQQYQHYQQQTTI